MMEIKTKAGNAGARLKWNTSRRGVVACLFVDDTVLTSRVKINFRVVDSFHKVSERQLKVNVGKKYGNGV